MLTGEILKNLKMLFILKSSHINTRVVYNYILWYNIEQKKVALKIQLKHGKKPRNKSLIHFDCITIFLFWLGVINHFYLVLSELFSWLS